MSRESQTALPGTPDRPELPGKLPDHLRAELIAFRRDLHMHPELGHQEFRTTAAIKTRLEKAGLRPRVLKSGTGLICDVGTRDGGRPMLALRADIDALPIPDAKTHVAYRSTVPDRAHACGHDVHTAVVLGAGLVLAELDRQGLLPRPVRLLFQPAEEVLPGGASEAIESGVLDGVGRIIAVHCDPRVDAGRIGLRAGAITSACDRLEVSLSGPGGHTARPHLTTDLVTAAARLAVDVPALLTRRMDARSGMSVTWGRIEAGHACNVIPMQAELSGTIRCLDLNAWYEAPDMIHAAIDEVATMHGAKFEINHVRGVPRWSTTRSSPNCSGRRWRPAAAPVRSRTPSRASAARTSPGTWSTSPAPWPASASAGPATPPSGTCTAATSTSTRARSASAWSSSPPPRCSTAAVPAWSVSARAAKRGQSTYPNPFSAGGGVQPLVHKGWAPVELLIGHCPVRDDPITTHERAFN